MPANYNSKRIQDAATFAHWDALPDAEFKQLGVSREQIKDIQSKMSGKLIFKGDPGYEKARHIFNPIFNAYPGVVAICETEADVYQALSLGKLVPDGFCLRSGGHSTAGYSTTNGVLIDVSALNGVSINFQTNTVTVGTGTPFSKLYNELNYYGLNVPGGECPDVCIGGYVQGGGYGFTSGSFGLNCDNAVQFRVMLADGTVVIANDSQNQDLYWALRGGTGGNFGVLLSVELRVRPLGEVVGFALAWPLSAATAISQASDAMAILQQNFGGPSATNKTITMQTSLVFQNWIDPSKPEPPPTTPLEPYFMIRGMSIDTLAQVKAELAQLIATPGCFVQWIRQDKFITMNTELLNSPQGMPLLDQMPFEDKSSYYVARNLASSEWNTLFTAFANAPNNMAYGYAELYSGAINTVGTYETAFIHRGVSLNMVMDVYWLLDADREKCETFLNTWNGLLEPMSNGESYQNYPSPSDPNYIKRFWGEAYPMLQAVKLKYDPNNDFAFPQQIWGAPLTAQTVDPGVPVAVTTAMGQPINTALIAEG